MRPIKGVPVEVMTYWMQGIGHLMLRQAIALQEEFGCGGLIPAEQQAKAEKLLEACRDVLRSEIAWHGKTNMAEILLGEGSNG